MEEQGAMAHRIRLCSKKDCGSESSVRPSTRRWGEVIEPLTKGTPTCTRQSREQMTMTMTRSLSTSRLVAIITSVALLAFLVLNKEQSQETALLAEEDLTIQKKTQDGGENDIVDRGSLRSLQVDNYIKGTGMLLNVHITHHAGTTFCRDFAKPIGPTPDFACMAGENWPRDEVPNNHSSIPWPRGTANGYIDVLRPLFHMISWEFGHQTSLSRPLYDTDCWENPRIVSVLIVRNPLDRLMAFDGFATAAYGEPEKRTDEDWWAAANHPVHSNNFALRCLSDYNHCCQGRDTPRRYLDLAKDLVRRMTFVLDQDCLDENLVVLAHRLNVTFQPTQRHHSPNTKVLGTKERIGNETLYQYLVERNKLDMELYRWAKTQSLLQCSTLFGNDNDDDDNVRTDGGHHEEEHSEPTMYNETGPLDANNTFPPSTLDDDNDDVAVPTNSSSTADQSLPMDRETLRSTQIDNYRKGKGLLLNVHITHHAGTAFCLDFARPIGPTPTFACMSGDNWPKDEMANSTTPWAPGMADTYIDVLRPLFHAISWEFGHQRGLPRNLNATDCWENPRLVSILIVRNPIDRLLAGDGMANNKYGLSDNRTDLQWWLAANDPVHSNNYALRVLSDYRNCCQGKDTPPEYLDTAKQLVERMTFVLDQDCLNANLAAMADRLNVTYKPAKQETHHKIAKERIQNETLYNYLLERNTLDMELYRWAKTKSLVQCNLPSDEQNDEDSAPNSTDSGNSSKTTPDANNSTDSASSSGKTPDDGTAADSREQEDLLTFSPTQRTQIQYYKLGTALMLNLHITHHAGTFMCKEFAERVGPTPSSSCMGGDNWPSDEISPAKRPWLPSETNHYIDVLRPKFHMIAWEFGQGGINPELRDVDWENPRLLSILVVRNPMDRLLAGDGFADNTYGLVNNRTSEGWWELANHRRHTNNYALRVLSDSVGCCSGKDTNQTYLDMAKKLVGRMTFVLDQDCLMDNLIQVARLLNLDYNASQAAKSSFFRQHEDARTRIGNDTLYEYLLERNKLDMELYYWSKNQSLVNCGALSRET